MSDVSQNPSCHLSKPPHKLSNKQVLLKNKPTKKIGRSRSKNDINNNNYYNSSSNNNNNHNKPLKVVHISNPMKFQVAAAEFRALVQELTGRDAVVEWPDEEHHLQAVAAAVVVAEDSGSPNSTDDQVSHQDEEGVDLSGCFGTSDLHQLSFDYFGAQFSGEHLDVMEEFRALIGDDGQSLLH